VPRERIKKPILSNSRMDGRKIYLRGFENWERYSFETRNKNIAKRKSLMDFICDEIDIALRETNA
jgi:hypothetical protein